jgi:hypothetical protein
MSGHRTPQLAEYTSELLDLTNVLGLLVELEPVQAALLYRLCSGPLIATSALHDADAFTDISHTMARSLAEAGQAHLLAQTPWKVEFCLPRRNQHTSRIKMVPLQTHY